MTASEALGRLRALRAPVVTTADVATLLDLTVTAASHTMRRLAAAGLVIPLRKGSWVLAEHPDPLTLVEYVTAPYPGYVSLQSALYLHGMIEQIPSSTYVVTLGRNALVHTPVGTFSIHHVQPALFGGAEASPSTGVRLATPEKALVDHLYLAPTRSRLFAALPELELPPTFDVRTAKRWVGRITDERRRTFVAGQLERLVGRIKQRRAARHPNANRSATSPRRPRTR